MNRAELITKVSEKLTEVSGAKVTKKAAEETLSAIVEVVTEALVKDDTVKIPDLGTFSVAERAAREGRNPQTGETIQIAASKAPKFKASKTLKDVVNA